MYSQVEINLLHHQIDDIKFRFFLYHKSKELDVLCRKNNKHENVPILSNSNLQSCQIVPKTTCMIKLL